MRVSVGALEPCSGDDGSSFENQENHELPPLFSSCSCGKGDSGGADPRV